MSALRHAIVLLRIPDLWVTVGPAHVGAIWEASVARLAHDEQTARHHRDVRGVGAIDVQVVVPAGNFQRLQEAQESALRADAAGAPTFLVVAAVAPAGGQMP